MAKNKDNKFAGKAKNRNTSGTSAKSTSNSTKDSHAQVPDSSPNRSGPGGN